MLTQNLQILKLGHFVHKTLVYRKTDYQAKLSRTLSLFFFCSFIFFVRSDKTLTYLTASLKSRNTHTQSCAPILCTVWPGNAVAVLPEKNSLKQLLLYYYDFS